MQALPATMKSPRDKRPSIWRNGVLQVWVTRTCDKACFNCTQGSNLGGKMTMIAVDQYRTAVRTLRDYFGVVGMFGGNPATHPQFDELCQVLRDEIPFEQRGLWCNHPRGKAKHARITFNPCVSNLNVHLDREAFDQFRADWPECEQYLKGLDPSWPEAKAITDPARRAHRVGDARHSPVFVSMRDLGLTDEEIWEKVARCDVNQFWSAMICVFRGELRAFFCEIAGAQAMLHQFQEDYPDTGLQVTPGWWNQGMDAFDAQVRLACFSCGHPMRGYGELAIGGTTEQVSRTHESIYKPKTKGREVQVVTDREQLKENALNKSTDYVENGKV